MPDCVSLRCGRDENLCGSGKPAYVSLLLDSLGR